MSVSVKVRVPGTTANCGPGFDAVGIACTIYNDLELTLSTEGSLVIEVEGEGASLIPTDDKNIVWQVIQKVFEKVGKQYQGIHIKMNNQIPLSRGLGSSAAAIVAGLFAANVATGNTLSKDDLLDMATAIEGHPDNVAPAIFGGITTSVVEGKKARYLRFVPPAKLNMIVAIPDFNLSTHAARQVLPETVPFKDAVFNISRTALVIGALCQGEFQHLRYALADKIHQPYREHLIPGMGQVFDAALEKGALGVALSGAGPCLIAFAQDRCEEVGFGMVEAFANNQISAKYLVLDIDTEGARVID
ncbi:homoserine kinase [Pelosinus sp. sgz500959]|uniref:homoserine kinase n=1 Tax=Pelosinus sp. sgz500959 TaxID=3242472 RepID=UPI00366EDB10